MTAAEWILWKDVGRVGREMKVGMVAASDNSLDKLRLVGQERLQELVKVQRSNLRRVRRGLVWVVVRPSSADGVVKKQQVGIIGPRIRRGLERAVLSLLELTWRGA